MNELHLLAMSYVFFLLLIGGEVLVSLRRRDGGYRLGEAVVNVGHGVVYQVWDSFTKVLVMVPFLWVGTQIPWETLPLGSPWAWLVGLIAYDFLSYWAHRHHHEVHLLWAIHGNHHAAEDFNLAAGLRQAMLQNAFRWIWKLPLALFVSIEMYVGLVVFDYLYQFLQHTRYVPKLGPLGWIMNTPSHHRVHHGRQPKYIDKNYGGILIIWDRLFGTFQAEEEEPEYGITTPLNTLNAVWANFAIMAQLAAATRRARGLDKLRLWVAPPGALSELAPGTIPTPPALRDESDTPLPLRIYVLGSSMFIPPALGWMLLSGDSMSGAVHLGVSALIVLSVVVAGGLLEGRAWAMRLDGVRWLGVAVLAALLLGSVLPLALAPLGLVAPALGRTRQLTAASAAATAQP